MTADWMGQARCRNSRDDFVLDASEVGKAEEMAAYYCGPCPVRTQCHAFAHNAEPRVVGLWAGQLWRYSGTPVDVLLEVAS